LLRINAVSGGVGNGGGILFANNNDVLNLARIAGLDAGNWGGFLAFYTSPGTGSSPGGTPTERMRITSTGNVGIGTTGPSWPLSVSANVSAPLAVLNQANGGQYASLGFQTAGGAWNISEDNSGAAMYFGTGLALGANRLVTINSSGNVGIGTTNPTYPLSVHGTIEATEVIIQTGWSDYVFDKSYHLTPLSEVESYIKTEHHLPGVPSEKQVAAKGVSLGDMQSKLLAQIEQLTLHVIEQEKEIQELKKQNSTFRQEITDLNGSITR
jgi:hypothetical protein